MRSLIALLTLALLAGGPLAAVAQDAKKDAKKAEKKAEKKTEKKEAKAPPKVVLSAAEKAAVAAIKKLGGSVLEVAQNDGRLDVAYHLADGKIGDKQLEPLKKIKHIHSLNLRGTEVTDAGLAAIAGLGSLERLHLEKTKVTDALAVLNNKTTIRSTLMRFWRLQALDPENEDEDAVEDEEDDKDEMRPRTRIRRKRRSEGKEEKGGKQK